MILKIEAMTKEQIYRLFASFTGDWQNAWRKVEAFESRCCVPLAQVDNIELSLSGCSDDALDFSYEDNCGESHRVLIM